LGSTREETIAFLNLPKPSSRQGATRHITEEIPGIFLEEERRQARMADNIAICEPILDKVWEPRRLTALQTSKARHSFSQDLRMAGSGVLCYWYEFL
jgi:hypothetical protein